MTRILPSAARPALQTVAALAAGLLAVGCNTAPKYTFAVSLKNASPEPVTVWLTKNGGPEENEWLAPEALADSRAAALDAVNGVVIPPGKTGDIGPITGRFDHDSLAILRVYAGQITFDQILATRADGKLRVDVPLREGHNQLVVAPTLPLRVEQVGPPAQAK